MKFEKGPIHDVKVTPIRKWVDDRGWLAEFFRNDEISDEFLPAMGYLSVAYPGVVRGPHEHRDQADLFIFMGPSNFKVALWDPRQNSPSFGKKMVVFGGMDSPVQVLVPKGVIHAYKNIGSEPGTVLNCPNRLYAGKKRKEPVDEIRHEEMPGSLYDIHLA